MKTGFGMIGWTLSRTPFSWELVRSATTIPRFSGGVSMLRAFSFTVFCAFVTVHGSRVTRVRREARAERQPGLKVGVEWPRHRAAAGPVGRHRPGWRTQAGGFRACAGRRRGVEFLH